MKATLLDRLCDADIASPLRSQVDVMSAILLSTNVSTHDILTAS